MGLNIIPNFEASWSSKLQEGLHIITYWYHTLYDTTPPYEHDHAEAKLMPPSLTNNFCEMSDLNKELSSWLKIQLSREILTTHTLKIYWYTCNYTIILLESYLTWYYIDLVPVYPKGTETRSE